MTSSEARPDVLLVEDSEHDAELTLRALRRYQPHGRVMWVRDGAEALQALFGHSATSDAPLALDPRVVLLDIKMPRVDGHQVLERIKGDARSRHIPVVVMSSSRVKHDVVRSLKTGANSYIVKPVNSDAFSETVQQVGAYWLRLNQPTEAV